MAVFTTFFCGTGSNSFDYANPNFPNGEIVSTLARHHEGTEYADWALCDGPGSGNLQDDELWVKPGKLSHLPGGGTGMGFGWNENVRHVIAMIKGDYEWKRA